MANPLKGEALVKVEAGEFTLAFDLGACVAIEKQGGKPLQEVLAQLDVEHPPVEILLVVIWAGLKKHHKLTMEDVGHLVALHEMEQWGIGIGKAFHQGEAKGNERPRRAEAA